MTSGTRPEGKSRLRPLLSEPLPPSIALPDEADKCTSPREGLYYRRAMRPSLPLQCTIMVAKRRRPLAGKLSATYDVPAGWLAWDRHE